MGNDMLLSSTVTAVDVRSLLIVSVVVIAVVTDLKRRRIYNALTFPTMAVGLTLGAIIDGPSGLLRSALGLLLGAALFVLPVAFLGRGAGDLKLLAAVGAIGGPLFVVWCALLTGAAGAVLAVAVLLAKRRFGVVIGGIALDAVSRRLPVAASNIRLPYAVPIAAGAVLSLAIL
jgi:prepilin peptidase CpaA